MSEKEQELIALALVESGYFGKGRAIIVSAFFEGVEDFLSVGFAQLKSLTYVSGKPLLKSDELDNILELRKIGLVDPEKPLADNFIAVISRGFTRRQVNMLRTLSLDSLNPNPFLIQSLNLSTPEEVIRLNVYAAATRSIVTSFGLIVQNMIGSTSETVKKLRSGWDLLKTDRDQRKHWIQVKSGPNDMDKDQVIYWSNQIDKVISEGHSGYIGMTYGKRDSQTVTIGLLKKYLPDWEMKTLIGKELWDFLSDDPDLHSRVLKVLREQATIVLNGNNILDELDNCVKRVTEEFLDRYGDGQDGVDRYLDDLF